MCAATSCSPVEGGASGNAIALVQNFWGRHDSCVNKGSPGPRPLIEGLGGQVLASEGHEGQSLAATRINQPPARQLCCKSSLPKLCYEAVEAFARQVQSLADMHSAGFRV